MKRIISAMVIILMLSMTTMVYAEETEAADYKKTGGWTNVSHEAEELPEEAQEAFDKATENLDGAEYTPVALLSTQLVASDWVNLVASAIGIVTSLILLSPKNYPQIMELWKEKWSQ